MEHKDALEKMAQALLEKETLNYDDVEKLIGPPPHGKKHLVSPVDFEQSLNQQSKMGSKQAEGVWNVVLIQFIKIQIYIQDTNSLI